MAPPWSGDGEAEKIPFRWLDAARYAAASVVTVLIVTVIVKATRVVLVPSSLYVSVVQGSIFFRRAPSVLFFDLYLRIDNPRRHACMYYVNVTTYLFDKDTPPGSLDPAYDCMIYFGQMNLAVLQQQSEFQYPLRLKATNRSMPEYFDRLYNDDTASISGVTMRMDATLVTEEITSGLNTSRPVTYYCWPLAILQSSGDAAAAVGYLGDDDVFCRDTQGSRFI